MKRLSWVLVPLAAFLIGGCSAETEPATDIGLHHTDIYASLNGKVACSAGDSGLWYFRYRRVNQQEQPLEAWNQTPNQSYACSADAGPVAVQKQVDLLAAESTYQFELCGVNNAVSTAAFCMGDNGDPRAASTEPTVGSDDKFTTPPLVVPPLCCPPPPDSGIGTAPPLDLTGNYALYEAKTTASGSGACVTGVARWFYRNSLGDLLWSIKMNQKNCLTGGGKQQGNTAPTVLVDVTALGRSTGWAYDCSGGSGACGGGYKVIGDAGDTEITQTKRVVRFIRCLPFSGQTICFKTEQFPMRNIFASSPGFINVSSYPSNN